MRTWPRVIAGALFASGLLLSAIGLDASAQTPGQIRLGYLSGDDWEPVIAADRLGNLFVLYPHYGGVPGCDSCPSPTALLQVSNDRGQTWGAPRIFTPENLPSYQVDMQLAVDPLDGRTMYASWLQNNKKDVLVTRSVDSGQTWSSPVIADSTSTGTDKPMLAVRGRDIYLGFDHQQKMWVSASHDGGVTFSVHPVWQNNEFSLSLAGGEVIDSHGYVYLAWAGYARSGEVRGPVSLYVSKSIDGGSTWTHTLVDTSSSPPDCSAFSCNWAYLGAQNTIAVDGANTLYMLWNAGAVDVGHERIYFARSTDGGSSWSPRQDVSLAPHGVDESFPVIVTGSTGNVRIAWMDARNAPRWNAYYRSSSDGGDTWSGETVLSSFVPGFRYIDAGGFAFPYGDYFSMHLDDRGATHVVWGEGPSWTGPGNIWYTRVAR